MAARKVSVIMATGNSRPETLRNTLRSWSRITYPVEFILVNTTTDPIIDDIAAEFPIVTKYVRPPEDDDSKDWARVSRVWTREGKASSGDYVIIAMADELLGNYDIVQAFISAPTEFRASLMTYFLSPAQTNALSTIDWLSDPKRIETLPDFWTHRTVQGADNVSNEKRKSSSSWYPTILAHITGAPRAHWDYTGWFRTDEHGYLWLDNDVHVRENFLQRPCFALMDYCCYHQWHPLLELTPEDRDYGGYIYQNELQARLLEPAVREKSIST